MKEMYLVSSGIVALLGVLCLTLGLAIGTSVSKKKAKTE
jgi:uncharacterized protein YneF (UPF0154 family)